MPELPEVETIKRGLEKKIIGLKIQKIKVLSPKSFIGKPKNAEGQIILKVWRRAKILGVDLSSSLRDHEVAKQSSADNHKIATSSTTKVGTPRNDKDVTLLIHLKMSGQLIYIPNDERITNNDERFMGGHPTEDMKGTMPNAHTRVIFTLESQESRVKSQGKQKSRLSTLATSHLYFNDQRKFGWVKIVQSEKLKMQSEKILGKLGPEPLEKDFTWEILKQNLLKHKNMPVKVAIMGQSVISGVGNIYSNEACFDAGIDPRKKVSQLSDREFKNLHGGIIKALRDGVKYGGSTIAHFVDAEGRKGYFIDYANVYGKEGYSCKNCPGKVRKITLGGRGTYFCPACQR